jgi:excisionase family DNA binding protein
LLVVKKPPPAPLPLLKDEPFLDIKEVAKRLGLHPSTVRRLYLAGRIPAVMVGSRPRFQFPHVYAALPRKAG